MKETNTREKTFSKIEVLNALGIKLAKNEVLQSFWIASKNKEELYIKIVRTEMKK